MNNKGVSLLILGILLLCTMGIGVATESPGSVYSPEPNGQADTPMDTPLETGLVFVRFHTPEYTDGSAAIVSDDEIASIHASVGTTVIKTFSPEFLPGLQVVEVPDSMTVSEAVAKYTQYPSVEYAVADHLIPREPDFFIPDTLSTGSTTFPDDPLYPSQWSLNNTGQYGGTPGADIDIEGAWNVTMNASPAIIVGVTDSGIDYLHSDIRENIWTDPATGDHGYDFYDDDHDPMDDDYHGTSCAGVIGATVNNAIGIAGISGDTELMALKIDGPYGQSDYLAIQAIEYATLHGADILSNSWEVAYQDEAMYDAISAFPGLFVWSAANDNMDLQIDDIRTPGFRLPNVIAVMATDKNDNRANFSNYGRNVVHLGAPGDLILSTYPDHKSLICDRFNSTENWTGDANWFCTNKTYISPPTSLGIRINGSVRTTTITLNYPVNLTGLENPVVGFNIVGKRKNGILYLQYSPDGMDWKTILRVSTIVPDGVYWCTERRSALAETNTTYFRFLYENADPSDEFYIDNFLVAGQDHVNPDYSYGVYGGTSAAAPHVAGVAALVMAAHPEYNTAQVKAALMNTVDQVSALSGTCITNGRLNASAAVRYRLPSYDAIGSTNLTMKIPVKEPVSITARFVNSGSATWQIGDGIALRPVSDDARLLGPETIPLTDYPVAPGEEVNISWTFSPPDRFGTIHPEWRLQRNGTGFGQVVGGTTTLTTWERLPDTSGTVNYALVANGPFIHHIGGGTYFSLENSHYRFDIRNRTWTRMADLPVVMGYIKGASINGRIYIPGGYSSTGVTNTTYVYDPSTDSWSQIPAGDGIPARYWYSTAVLADRLYVLGGYSGGKTTSLVYYLNTTTSTWHQAPSMHESRYNCMVSAGDGSILAAGGWTNATTRLKSVERFNGTDWSSLADIPGCDSWAHAGYASAPDGSLWIAGGVRIINGKEILEDTATCNLSTGAWMITPDLPVLGSPRSLAGGAIAPDGYFYLGGGLSETYPYGAFERLNVWTPHISGVTGLTNTTWLPDSITWNWTCPDDPVLDHVMISLDGVFQANLTGVNAFTASGLMPQTPYTLSVQTVDLFGNPGTRISHTAMTALAPPVYTLNSSSDAFGYIRPEGVMTKDPGSNQTYDIRSLPGAEIARLTDNETPVSVPTGAASYTYPLTNIADNHTVTVTNDAKEGVILAAFTANQTSGQAPLTVLFTDTSAGGPDRWYWTFGDGMSSMDRNATHTYSEPGIYDVSLWIRNGQATGSIEKPGMISVQ